MKLKFLLHQQTTRIRIRPIVFLCSLLEIFICLRKKILGQLPIVHFYNLRPNNTISENKIRPFWNLNTSEFEKEHQKLIILNFFKTTFCLKKKIQGQLPIVHFYNLKPNNTISENKIRSFWNLNTYAFEKEDQKSSILNFLKTIFVSPSHASISI